MSSQILVNIASGNGLSPILHQVITYNVCGILSIGPLESIYSEMWLKYNNFNQESAFQYVFHKMADILLRPQYINIHFYNTGHYFSGFKIW